ncbi:MAG: glycosyltransferase family 9 protein [Candidatus Omnitrophica bacterium]|nr:glycosyltransferase family 9 protein [Candidatus Omnitrophota bacterium]
MNTKRILVITLSNIGDVILTTSVIDAIIDEFPGAELDIIVGPKAKDIFEKHKNIHTIYVYDKHTNSMEKLKLIKELCSKHYDIAVDLKHTVIPYLVGAKVKSPAFGRIKKDLHKKYQHLSVIKSMGINTENAKLNIQVSQKDRERVSDYLKQIKGKFIVVSCGAKSHTKRWPTSYFAALCDKIKNDLGCEVVLVGKEEEMSPDSDRIVIDEVKQKMKAKAHDFIGMTNVRELSVLIKESLLLITNDSAPLHVASAVNIPTIAIFGPTDEKKYGPLADRSIVLRKKLKCTPCEKAQCEYNYECMRKITVDDAFKAVKEIVKQKI